MRSIALFSLAVALTICASGASAQVISESKQVGGPGGGAFDDRCHPGDVLIGFNLTAGTALNTVAPVCQPILNGIYNGPDYGLITHGKVAEGTGGNPNGPNFGTAGQFRCRPGQAVYEMHVWVDKYGEVQQASVSCEPLLPNTGRAAYLGIQGGSGKGVRDDGLTCGPNAVAIGMIGRSGTLVDSIGLVCSTFSWHIASAAPTCPATPVCSAPAPVIVSVLMDSQVWSKVGHQDADLEPGVTLSAGTPNVKLLEFVTPDFHVSWQGGDGWVYNGNDVRALNGSGYPH